MPACTCNGVGSACPCSQRGGYYGTKVITPAGSGCGAVYRSAEALPEAFPLDKFSVPELREFMREQGIVGRGNKTKAQMVELLARHLRENDQDDLALEYAERYGRL